ncbi:MAG: hypothetical protein GKR99_16650 [Rhodobacteraceae bacterium]|nr:hypothetical protein [Paracoccaceae bacterium]
MGVSAARTSAYRIADCVEKLRNQSVADFLRKPMKRNSRKALTTRQRMAARERM